MHLDVVILSRIQFALTIMFHYIFPPITIGLGLMLVIFEGLYLKTQDKSYQELMHFWLKIFALNFAVGVATGIVMEFEFGTNWSTYSRFVGDVFGSALASEGIFAFFLESGFLSILLFGFNKVSPKFHFFSTIMVFLGSVFSSVWIVIANSFQQTPAGYHLVKQANGFVRAEITDFWAMVFNPSSMYRLTHVLLGAFIIGASLVASVCSFYLLKQKFTQSSKIGLKIAIIVLAVNSFAMMLSGHDQARAVAFNQPIKLAALEGHYHSTNGGTRLSLIGLPNSKTMSLEYSLSIPNLLSFLVYNNFNKPVKALDQFSRKDWPPVFITFESYHLMVAIGVFYLFLSSVSLILLYNKSIYTLKPMLLLYCSLAFIGTLANQSGWVAAEVGRQPWIVYGLLRTSDAVSKVVPEGDVIFSIILFGTLYLVLLFIYIYTLTDKILHGPKPFEAGKQISVLEAASDLSSHGQYSMIDSNSGQNNLGDQ